MLPPLPLRLRLRLRRFIIFAADMLRAAVDIILRRRRYADIVSCYAILPRAADAMPCHMLTRQNIIIMPL